MYVIDYARYQKLLTFLRHPQLLAIWYRFLPRTRVWSQPEITQLKVKDLQLKVNKSNNSLADTSFRSERVSA